MEEAHTLIAVNIGREIKVREVAKKILKRRIRIPWEEPLYVRISGTHVMVWAFGSFVAVDPKKGDIEKIVETLKPFTDKFTGGKYKEEYRVVFTEKLPEDGDEDELEYGFVIDEDECYVLNSFEKKYVLKIIGYVLAQSVALERIEGFVDKIMEQSLTILNDLQRGLWFRLKPAINRLAQVMTMRIELLSDLMILTKPSVAWESEELEMLYEALRDFYEIEDRFEAVDRELESVQELSSIATDIILASRETMLEFLIVFLIVVEILLIVIYG